MAGVKELPDVESVVAARERLSGHVRQTPLLRHANLDARAGARIWVKAECLQHTGSFKIRGATNKISQLTPDELSAGVVAFSSGNHAQGVARAARLAGCPAVIVMPSDAPKVKLDGVRADGAEIVLYDREHESREEISARIARERGALLIPSYDDADIVAGQGTLGLDILDQAQEAGILFDHLLCCTGGGGLISGMSLVFERDSPATQLWACEPEGHDDWKRSLEAHTIQANRPGFRSFCDAILTPEPGVIPFQLADRRLAGGLVVTDEEVRDAMRFAFQHLKLVVEPGGAVALAAALRGVPDAMRGTKFCVVLTGGNVDPDLFAEVITSDA